MPFAEWHALSPNPPVPLAIPVSWGWQYQETQAGVDAAHTLTRQTWKSREDLRQTQHWLERYFDTREKSVSSVIATLKGLSSADLSLELPTLNETLGSLRSFKLSNDKAFAAVCGGQPKCAVPGAVTQNGGGWVTDASGEFTGELQEAGINITHEAGMRKRHLHDDIFAEPVGTLFLRQFVDGGGVAARINGPAREDHAFWRVLVTAGVHQGHGGHDRGTACAAYGLYRRRQKNQGNRH